MNLQHSQCHVLAIATCCTMRPLLATKVAASACVQTALHSLLFLASCRVRLVSDPALLSRSGEQTTACSANQRIGNSEDGCSTCRGTHEHAHVHRVLHMWILRCEFSHEPWLTHPCSRCSTVMNQQHSQCHVQAIATCCTMRPPLATKVAASVQTALRHALTSVPCILSCSLCF